MNTKTNHPTVPELLDMPPEELVKHGYERTQHGVQKAVNPLVTQLDLSAIAILKRDGIDPTVEAMNTHFLFNGGNVKLVELDAENPISEDNTENGSDVIRVNGILSNGNAIEMTIGIEYISKFPEDEPSHGHVVPEHIQSTRLWNVTGETFRSFNRKDFSQLDGLRLAEGDGSFFCINGKKFTHTEMEDPGYISVEFTEQTN